MRLLSLLLVGMLACAILADGPLDNLPEKVRPIPPLGIKLSEMEKADLKSGVESLGRDIATLHKDLKTRPQLARLIPDVEVFHKAVRYALEMNEFHTPAEVKLARGLLKEGLSRASQLREGNPSWTTATGLVVRGFRSRLDDSVQPYGLIVPANFKPGGGKHRLDVWLHGRGEKVSEVTFLGQRMRDRGQFTPAGAFVLHPHGRYCNAFKFAGEIDVLEAIDHVKQHYAIDEDRLVMRGFSMGGAGCWQFAVHYPDRWCAAAPGAGFSETPLFLDVFQKEKLAPTEYEKKLWRLYDCDGYAANLTNLPTVAYSGEKDRQKQAADVMEAALKKQGIELVHLIGTGAGHSYTSKAKEEIDRRIDRLAAKGRDRVPGRVRLATYTLRYNKNHWVTIDGMAKHWERAEVDAELIKSGTAIDVKAKNVMALTLSFGEGDCPALFARAPSVTINGRAVVGLPVVRSDQSWSVSLHAEESGWKVGPARPRALLKRHGLQGPIDDAFMDRFIMVRPTGKPMHEKTAAWVKSEMDRAIREWRRHFRGDAIVKDDKDVTAADIASSNLILWGDPSSNALIAKIAGKLPFAWDVKAISARGKTWPADTRMLLMIYPNPLNADRYVVLNSGFTYREYDYLNNARQTPKLPDWAVVDVTTPPSSRFPGKVGPAGFFVENWELRWGD